MKEYNLIEISIKGERIKIDEATPEQMKLVINELHRRVVMHEDGLIIKGEQQEDINIKRRSIHQDNLADARDVEKLSKRLDEIYETQNELLNNFIALRRTLDKSTIEKWNKKLREIEED